MQQGDAHEIMRYQLPYSWKKRIKPWASLCHTQVITTPEEIEAFHVIRAILRNVVPTRRVFMRDAQSYCAILLDDNNRKPICRLRFNNSQKLSVGIFNDKKEEERIAIESVDDIYEHSDKLTGGQGDRGTGGQGDAHEIMRFSALLCRHKQPFGSRR
ncbi:hypothetical protein GMPD_20320 [Geomonas paludis]|uniref:Uncharacterized protein n=1 Tax=Geomonas paludis TaxID=2740185 RepID=A0A6V8MX35_9BACT|nr:hypothetical protein GMPD_20320 [Geomonas paludis]